MSLHATLSPSSAERWISCPASVRMTEVMPDDEGSVYAQEGTAAHALAELLARDQIIGSLTGEELAGELSKWRKKFDVTDEAEAEMTEHGQGYVNYILGQMAAHPDSVLFLEQRVPNGLPNSWGTSDAIIVSPDYVESIDYKYGMGVRVEAVGNPQLRLYAVGALETFGDLLGDVETVSCTVYQPRLHHVASEEISADALREWRDNLLPIAELALGPDAPFGPSDEACRWCPASGSCMAQMEWATARDFGVKADFMSTDELARALDEIPFILQWCAAVQNFALDAVYSKGLEIPGYKVVMSGGKRSVKDHAGLIETAVAMGYEREQVSRVQAVTIGDLEKLLKKDFDIVAGPYVAKSSGSPSLVPESDSREAINPEGQAAKDFSS